MSKRRRGFSLSELLIAIGVAAIAVLGTISVFAYGIRSNEHAELMSKATGHAQQMMDLIRNKNFAWDATDALNQGNETTRTPLNAAPLADFEQFDPRFWRDIEVTKPAGAGHLATLAKVRVRIFWNEKSDSGATVRSVEFVTFSVDLSP